MIDAEDIDELLDRLRAFPDQLRALISGRSENELTRAAPGGGWGPVEVFCHLRDIEELIAGRCERILHEDIPYLPAVDETLWPIERDYAAQNPHIALEQFAEQRARFTHLLAGLDRQQLERRGQHAEDGDQTILWYAQHAADHDSTHREQLRMILGT
jgi:hypothetical protein